MAEVFGNDPIQPPQYTQGLERSIGASVGEDMDDKELVKMVKEDLGRYQGEFKDLHDHKNISYEYWRGNQASNQFDVIGQKRVVVNRIFSSIETMVANVTAETPLPWVVVFPKSVKGRKLSDKLDRWLRDAWEYEYNMQQVMEKMLRSYYVSRVGMLKYGYDKAAKKPFTTLLDLESYRFDITAKSIDDSPYFIQFVKEPITKVLQKYPDKAEEIKKQIGKDNLNSRSTITYVEYWVDFYKDGKKHNMVSWIFKEIVLDKEIDPFWSSKNHFAEPKKPFIPMNSINLNNSVVDDTSQIEQSMSLQDAINRRKEQVEENAKWANGIMVTTASAMSGDTFDEMGPATRKLRLRGEVENIDSAFGVKTAQPFSNGIFADQADSKAELDNIMGTHDVTRGEKGTTETLGGQSLRQQADLGRLDLTVRAYQQVAEDWYNAMVQLMYVFDMKDIKILSDREESLPEKDYVRRSGMVEQDDKQDSISKKEIRDYKIKVIVKKDAVPMKTPAAMQQAALTLMQTGMIDPFLFAEMFGLENPRKIARRAHLFRTDPAALFPELSGEEMTEPQAIQHIEAILNSETEEEVEEAVRYVFSDVGDPQNMTQEDLQAFSNHINTHSLYIKGVEVDEDLPEFQDLKDSEKRALIRHVGIETGIISMASEQLPVQSAESLPPEELEAAVGGMDPTTQPIEPMPQVTQPL